MAQLVPHVAFLCDRSGSLGFFRGTIAAEEVRHLGYADVEAARRIHDAITTRDLLNDLLYLAVRERSTPLPASLSFARECMKSILVDLLLDLRMGADGLPFFPTDGVPERLLAMSPSLPGLSRSNISGLWISLGLQIDLQYGGKRAVAEAVFRADPTWARIGEVELRLSEDPEHEALPFLLEATYVDGLSDQNRVRRSLLGDLFTRTVQGLPRLTMPRELVGALASSRILRQLAVNQSLMYPTLLSPGETYSLLQEVPAIKRCGVSVVVPAWWECRRPPQLKLVARVGTRAPSGFGLAALLDFQVSYLINDLELPPAEWARLMAENSGGLVRAGGRWHEVEHALLEATARAWKSTEVVTQTGVPLAHAIAAVRSAGTTADLEPLRVSFVAGAWLEELLSSHQSGTQADHDVGAELRATLRPYQREGVVWLLLMTGLGAGVCLADDMGLGKTLQVLALVLRLRQREVKGPHLLVVPASLIGNWCEEITAHAPTLSTAVVHHAHPETTLEQADLVITSYATLLRQPELRAREWPLIVLDEAQAIKNAETKQAIMVKQLRGRMRIALTGTPVENNLGELWSIFDFLNPGLLGNAAAFKDLTRGLGSDPKQVIESVRAFVRPFILRRMKTDPNVIRDLPEKVEIPVFCGLTSLQARLYGQVVHDLETRMRESDGIQRRGHILAALMHFKQICNHPAQYVKKGDFIPEQSAKFLRLRSLCEPMAERGERALVFTQFRELTAPLADYLATIFGRPGLVIHGDTPITRRTRLVADFQREDGPPFMVLTLKVGGIGLNLTAATHVIHFDRWWNPAAENQASDRAFRIGQTKNVMVHKFVCRGTLEQRIDEMLRLKQTLADDILSETDTPHLTELGPDELLGIVRLDPSQANDVDLE